MGFQNFIKNLGLGAPVEGAPKRNLIKTNFYNFFWGLKSLIKNSRLEALAVSGKCIKNPPLEAPVELWKKHKKPTFRTSCWAPKKFMKSQSLGPPFRPWKMIKGKMSFEL